MPSAVAVRAFDLVTSLQRRFVGHLEAVALASQEGTASKPAPFGSVSWDRNAGRHGGGTRFGASEEGLTYNRASVNVSLVHYDDDPARPLGSASALSTIVHPAHPRAPSVHVHLSWTEYKDGTGYWRLMADLNPAIEDPNETSHFRSALKAAIPLHATEACDQGNRYFYIPALGRHRGVAHFYLEAFTTGDGEKDFAIAQRFGETALDTYAAILRDAIASAPPLTPADQGRQLAYHTLYLFQVLTLDRGTTSGLLVHDQNDVGILGSLPARVDRDLLATWREKVVPEQVALVDALVAALPGSGAVAVDDGAKQRLAKAVRAFYKANPEALALQAKGDVVPPTVDNHGPPA